MTVEPIRFGDERLPPTFWNKVVKGGTGCWLWTASKDAAGYGFATKLSKSRRAHRVAYEALVRPITAESIDHLCRVTCCVNPSHMEEVPIRENTLRGFGPTAMNAMKTRCFRGHPLAKVNKNGRRECFECPRARWLRAYYAKKEDAS